MKKDIFFIILFIAVTISHTNMYGQCDSPSTCTQVTFMPSPTSQIPTTEFDLNCNSNSIEAILGIPGATDVAYQWYSDNMSDPVEGILVSPTPGTYTLEITYMIPGVMELVCCTQQIVVNEWGTIPVEIFAPADTCQGSSFNVLATSSFDYIYTWTVDGVVTEDDDAATFINTLTSNSIDITVRVDSAGCSGFASTTITVHEPPVATAQADNTSICAGDNVIISVDVPPPTSIYTYMWNTGQTNNDFLDTPVSSTNYQVTVTDPNGCVVESSINVAVSPIPNATISTDNETICFGQDAILNAPTGMDNYSWMPTGETTQSITVAPEETMDYIVEVTEGGCTNMDTITITVIPQGNISIEGPNEVCMEEEITLTAPLADSYLWSPDGQTTQSIVVSPSINTTYSVTITAAGCNSSGTKDVTVNPAPTATITGDTEICEEESTTLTAGGGGSYMWSNGETTQSITVNPTETTTYTVTVTAANGCTDTETKTVNFTSVSLAISGDTEICEGESTTLTASGGGTYVWSTGETTQSIMVSPTETTDYDVTKTVGECSLNEDITVSVNQLPVVLDATLEDCVGIFDLTEADINNESGTSTTYYENSNLTSQITNPENYESSGGTVYGSVEFDDNGCASTAEISLIVQDIQIEPDLYTTYFGNICSSQTITVAPPPDTPYNYTWSSTDGSGDVLEGDECTALDIVSDPTNFSLEISDDSGCLEVVPFSINLSAAPSDAQVFRSDNTNILFCNRNDFDSYQWGRELKTGLCAEPMVGETFQDVVIQDIDLDNYYYWVIVTEGNCTNKVYLTGTDNSPFGKLVVDPNAEYGDLALQVNPNPNNGAFELIITGDEVRDLDVHLYDAIGRAIYHRKAPKINGIETYYIAPPNLTQGLYFVQVTGNDDILLTEKIIVK